MGHKQLQQAQFTLLAIAVLAFELFNFAVTEIAVTTLIGDSTVLFIGVGTLFALAFCFSDIAGISRAFTPETSISKEPLEVILGTLAWFVAAIINAGLNWYALAVMMTGRSVGNAIVDANEVVTYFPVIGAAAVLLIRFMLVNSIVFGIEHARSTRASTNRTMSPRSMVKPKPFNFEKKPAPFDFKSLGNLGKKPAAQPDNHKDPIFEIGEV